MLEKQEFLSLLIMAAVLLLASCAPDMSRIQSILPSSEDLTGAPVWVTRGCPSLYKGTDRHSLFGVGSSVSVDKRAPGKTRTHTPGSSKTNALSRPDAILQAKNEITPALQSIARSILQDYGSTGGDEEFQSSAGDAQKLEDLSKQITTQVLAETPIVDSWVSPGGSFYALVRIDTDTFRYSVFAITSLSETMRKGIMERTDKAFEGFDLATVKKTAK